MRPSETFRRVLLQQSHQKRFQVLGHIWGKFNGVFYDVVDQGVDAVRVKRRLARVQLKEYHAQ